MNAIKFKSGRPELTIAEAAEIYGCTVEDLIYEAEIGTLSIYTKPSQWELKLIASIKTPEPKSDTDSIEHIKQRYEQMLNIDKCFDQLVDDASGETVSASTFGGEFTIYPNNNFNRLNYIQSLNGVKPISEITMHYYRLGLDADIFLKLNDLVGISKNSTESFFLITLPFVRFIDALNDGKLLVMKAELLKLVSDDAKNEVPSKSVSDQEFHKDEHVSQALHTPIGAELKQTKGLTTSDLAMAFADIHWSLSQWKSYLADCPKWLINAQDAQGKKGKGGAAIWNPVKVAKSLLEQDAKLKLKLNTAFKNKPILLPWVEEWKEHQAILSWYQS